MSSKEERMAQNQQQWARERKTADSQPKPNLPPPSTVVQREEGAGTAHRRRRVWVCANRGLSEVLAQLCQHLLSEVLERANSSRKECKNSVCQQRSERVPVRTEPLILMCLKANTTNRASPCRINFGASIDTARAAGRGRPPARDGAEG